MKSIPYVLLSLALLLIPAFASPLHAQTQPQEITVNLGGEPAHIDPNRSSFDIEAATIRQVFEPLLRFGPDLTPQPAAAESYDVAPDGRTYTFHLRPDGRWSDGQPVTASQFEYSWKRILDPSLGAEYASFYVDAGIVGAADYNSGKVATPDNVGVKALDDLTLQITLEQPFGPLPDLAALWVTVPERPDVVSANPDGWAGDPSTFIGNGPMMMTEWQHQDHITFKPNPYYVAHGMWPAPTVQTLTFLMVTDFTADYAAFLNGERDWTAQGVPDANVQQVLSDPDLSARSRLLNQLTTFWLDLNNTVPPLDNVLVRRAFSKAIDRTALIRDVLNGVGLTSTSIIPPGMPGYVDGLGKEWDFDPQAAQSLLSQAGYPNGQGFPKLTFNFATTSRNQRIAEFVQAQLKQNLNVDITLNSQEAKAEIQSFNAKNYQMAYHGWGADYPDPQDWFNTLFGCKGGNNKTNYCNAQVDQLIEQADKGTDLNGRAELYAQAQKTIVDDMTVVPLLYRGRLLVVQPYVQNMITTPQDEFPGDWFLDFVSIAPH